MTKFLIWGGGGHGKVIADLIRARRDMLLGYIDRDSSKIGRVVEAGGGRVVVPEGDFLKSLEVGDSLPGGADAIALGIGDNQLRLAARMRLHGVSVPQLIHPTAIVSQSAEIGGGSVVFPAAVVNASARIGEAVIINTGAIVEHDCIIEDGAHISPGAVLGGSVQVGMRSWVGAGATIIPGVRVGADVIVGAGAVVIHDVSSGSTIAGVPAKPIHLGGA